MFALPDTPSIRRVGVVSTYPPTRCGIARFAYRLTEGLAALHPELEVDVVRLVDRSGLPAIGRVRAEFDPNSEIGVRSAARILDRTDAVILQHEYGIYGANDGESVIDLVDQIHQPVVTILHTVLAQPSPRQRRIVQQLHARSGLVVLCEKARDVLSEVYEIPSDLVTVVHHGSDWRNQPLNPAPRRRLISWGLLGPGKGLERGIRALAQLRDMAPSLHYSIVGRTHPNVLRREGVAYRTSLEELATRLGVGSMVSFVDRYVDEDELVAMIRSSDLVLVPYDNQEQMASGVVTDALAAGRPVVATRFPYAVEMLSSGCGVTVGHADGELASAVRELLDDDHGYRAAAAAACELSRKLTWQACAERVFDLAHRSVSTRTGLGVR